MKCKNGHSEEQMKAKSLGQLPPSLRGKVTSSWFTVCPICKGDVYVEASEFIPLIGCNES